MTLQQNARLQEVTQNRLATGLKVSTAIENPSAYYTAQSLNNRSTDLTFLLDSMSQGIQTIKATIQNLEIAGQMLEQAKAVANKTFDDVIFSTSTKYEGPIAATVTNEAELLDAIANIRTEDGAIVIANDIILNKNTELVLKDNMKLVGKDGNEKLTFNFDSNVKAIGIDLAKFSEVSGLVIDYSSANKRNGTDFHLFRNRGYPGVKLSNLDITLKSDVNVNNHMSAIYNLANGEITLSGKINISAPSISNRRTVGIYNVNTSSKIIQTTNSVLNIITSGESGYGIVNGTNTLAGTVNISTSGSYGCGIYMGTNSLSGEVNISTSGTEAYGIFSGTNSLSSSAELLIKNQHISSNAIHNSIISYSSGAKLGIDSIKNTAGKGFWQATTNKTSVTQEIINTLNGNGDWNRFGNFPGIDIDPSKALKQIEPKSVKLLFDSSLQYSSLLTQFDNLIKDGGYKGVNLLLEQNLKINFNEDSSSKIEIKGVNASSKSLGLETLKWNNQEDIKKSISELDTAITQLRRYSEEFGNSFSIVSTREDFTNHLINVLQEGIDKLTLADMNQESSNMLSLETRQQLATNALSLASQASQSVLKLF